MPNGISCAYFAARNHIYGKQEDNPFKEGIAGIQTARTIDAFTKSGAIKGPFAAPVSNFFNGVASVGKKIVYPLIIGSGVYNTIKSDDKVKTGASNALGISSMYCFEVVAEKALNNITNVLSKSQKFTNNKFAKAAWYIAKGITFVLASLGGYNVGSKAAETFVDEYRRSKSSFVDNKSKVPTAVNSTEIKDTDKTVFPIEDGLKESQIFSEMTL